MIVFSKPLEIIKSTHPCFEGAHKSLWSDYCPLVRFVASHCCWQGGDDDDESEDRKISTEEEKEWRGRAESNFSKIVCGHLPGDKKGQSAIDRDSWQIITCDGVN